MDPWKSWAVVALVAVGAAYYYTQTGKSKASRDRISFLQATHNQQRASDTRNDTKDRRRKKGKVKVLETSDHNASDAAEVSSTSTRTIPTDKIKNRKKDKQQPSKLAQSSAVDASEKQGIDHEDVNGEEEEMCNKEFAKQLVGLKTGTSLKQVAGPGKENKKTRKQGKSKELKADTIGGDLLNPGRPDRVQDMSTPSSATGADADDDLSLPVSPELAATKPVTSAAGDMSDMLEAPAKGPSVLRITQSPDAQPPRQQKPKKATPEPETKKQRQNRQKNEEKKAQREQAEKERRVLLEKQLRTAREAEGRPAKNGLTAPTAPATSAWAASPAGVPAASNTPSATSNNDALLDTFDEDKSFLDQPTAPTDGGANSESTKDGKAWNYDLPSEEEQMRLIKGTEGDDSWNTVGKGGKNKKKSTKGVQPEKSLISESSKNIPDQSTEISSNNVNGLSVNNYSSSINGKTTSESDALSISGYPRTSSDSLTAMSSNHSEDLITTDKATSSAHQETDTSDKKVGPQSDKAKGEDNKPTIDPRKDRDSRPSRFPNGVPPEVSKLWRSIARNLDKNKWNPENIHEHPEYDPDWPYALTGHPMDSDWTDDWDFNEFAKKLQREEKDSALKATEKSAREGKKETK